MKKASQRSGNDWFNRLHISELPVRAHAFLQRPATRLTLMGAVSFTSLSVVTAFAYGSTPVTNSQQSGNDGVKATTSIQASSSEDVASTPQPVQPPVEEPTPAPTTNVTVNGQTITPAAANTTVHETITNSNGSVTNVTVSSSAQSSGSRNSETDQTTKVQVKSSSGDATNRYNLNTRMKTDSN